MVAVTDLFENSSDPFGEEWEIGLYEGKTLDIFLQRRDSSINDLPVLHQISKSIDVFIDLLEVSFSKLKVIVFHDGFGVAFGDHLGDLFELFSVRMIDSKYTLDYLILIILVLLLMFLNDLIASEILK